jgi:ABC-type bacteriocin/lantibiotic exporter with double-glycine peptidase domain
VKTARSFPFIQQRGMMECGSACLAMIFRYYGYYNIQSLLSRLGEVTIEGMSLHSLSTVATQFGFQADAYELDWDHLHQLKLPLIAHYKGNHFIVVYGISGDKVRIADPAYGKDTLSREEFVRNWNGIALEVAPTAEIFGNKDLEETVATFMDERKSLYRKFYRPVILSLRRVMLEILLATALLQALGLAIPFFTQTIIDDVLVNQNRKLLLAILAGMGIVFLTQVILLYVRNVLLVQLRVNFELDFFSRFFRHFISLRQKYYDGNKREDFMARFQENMNIRQLVNPAMIENIIDLLFVLLYVPVLLFMNVKLGLIALGFVLFYAAVTAWYAPKMRSLVYKVFYRNMETLGEFLDALLGVKSIKLLSIEGFKFGQWKSSYKKTLNVVLESEHKSIVLHSIQRSLHFFSQLAIFWVGGYMCFSNEISIGQYLAITSIFLMVLNSLFSLSGIWYNLTELWVSIGRLNDVLIQETEQRNVLRLSNQFSTEKVSIRNLAFRYNQKDQHQVLRNINLDFHQGEHIGIVGRNGTGKTTLVKLLLNLYPDYEGEILYGATEMRQIDPGTLRKKVFLFPQDIYIFNGTIRENILYGNLNAGMEDVIRAAKLAGLHDYIKDQYLGYNTKVGDMGSNLSGGQKLKIGFARLFLSDPDIIILDEASSMLDVESEREILQNIRSHFKGKTLISIAHRMNTLRRADRIWVIDGGTIAEEGRHDELINAGGVYQQFMKTYVDF